MSDGVVIIVSRAGPYVGLSGEGVNPERVLLADLILSESLLQTPRTFFICQPLLFPVFLQSCTPNPNLTCDLSSPLISHPRGRLLLCISNIDPV